MSFTLAKPRRRSSLSMSTSSSSPLNVDIIDDGRQRYLPPQAEDKYQQAPTTPGIVSASMEGHHHQRLQFQRPQSGGMRTRVELEEFLSRYSGGIGGRQSDGAEDHDEHSQDVTGRGGVHIMSSKTGDDVWGMPDFYEVMEQEMENGIKVVSLPEAKKLMEYYHDLSVPTKVLFPWLHGIGDGPDGAYGPLESFFGNPALDPPRYRGLCFVRAPHATGLVQDQGQSGSTSQSQQHEDKAHAQLGRDEVDEGDDASPTPMTAYDSQGPAVNTMRRDTMTSQISSSPSTQYSVNPASDWDASSYNQSYGSGAYSPPTRTGSLASYPGDGSPTSNWKMAADDNKENRADRGRASSVEWVADASSRVGSLASLRDSPTEEEEAVPEGMHPTCVKAPAIRWAKRTSDGSRNAEGESNTAKEGSSGLVFSVQDHEAPDRSTSHSTVSPRRPSDLAQTASKSSVIDSGRRSTTPPIVARSISTPEVPVSAHPADQVSVLRTISGRGMARASSPAPATAPIASCSVMRTPDMGNLTIPEDDDSDIELELPACPAVNDTSAAASSAEIHDIHPEAKHKSCMLVNALRAETLLDLDKELSNGEQARFLPPDLGGQISLRNLMIQEIKYATISDLVIYAPQGLQRDSTGKIPLLEVAKRFAQAQEISYRERLDLFYEELLEPEGTGDVTPGSNQLHSAAEDEDKMIVEPNEFEPKTFVDVLVQAKQRDQWQDRHRARLPIRYRVYILTQTFAEIEKQMPQLVEATGEGLIRPERDLQLREALESTKLSGASMIADGIWLGNGRDDPFRPDRVSPWLDVDLAIEAHDLADMPDERTIEAVATTMASRARPRIHYGRSRSNDGAQPQSGPIYLEVGSSSRSSGCCVHPDTELATRLIALVECVSKVAKLKRKDTKENMTILLFCEDGYTETSLFALAYTMYTRNVSLVDAYLTLHLELHRSFFVYPFDLHFLRVVEQQITESLGKPKKSAMRPTSPINKWNPFGISFPRSPTANEPKEEARAATLARKSAKKPEGSGSNIELWMKHSRFDGSLPSRIADHLYLGNLGHAVNSGMLKALGITHVVSVGETLSAEASFIHGHYVDAKDLASNCNNRRKLNVHDQAITVLDIQNVKDDGQDNLQPQFQSACAFIEEARKSGGKTLVHCRVGVSRSATIVIAYLMVYQEQSLMDAYLMTRARRLNVLIQPSLLFLREALHLESDLNRNAANPLKLKSRWTWPALCRDIVRSISRISGRDKAKAPIVFIQWALNKRYLQPN